ncbi:2-(1,2-epoxy-1,2-dihydrophenyl)acetyl-CoA isomerase [Arcicella aurantiaca]|uniref:2-(1,2-epoxy-1,2-dihydrophenyl)acetyl-CoA isomerase n=1 Tax=Arcicella aurantiaca TaxID=591202 RepID=A0A316EK86_9BACT|nr:enoyl-CoA hydratase-related protein [Arcicella aurantiaca]PWK29322.1 2-(1,2-epoxy-1,2-dihydrophenyl)acetyl-CoA isomerase [Arcicella aurantiaca]
MFNHLLYEINDGVCTITLNRPEVYNALSPALIQEITQAFTQAGEDSQVRVVVLTGSGDKAFSSGADLKNGLGGATSLGESLRKNYNPMILSIRNLAKPVICRLNGIAAGAGCSLALACDVIIASENAKMSQIFVSIGLIIDAGSSYFLPRLIGSQKAFELASTGRIVGAKECLELGLVNNVVTASELDITVTQTAQMYAKGATQAIGLIKKVLNQSYHSTLDQMLELEAQNQDVAGKTNDFTEGVTAFLQKRPTNFQGS